MAADGSSDQLSAVFTRTGVSRREAIRALLGAVVAGYGVSQLGQLSRYADLVPEVSAAKSDQVIAPTPALVYSKIDGKFTDMSELKLTPLGEQLVAQDKKLMPVHEWADAMPSPQTLYDYGSLTEGNAYIRMKYYEKGWIDGNRWLDILIDHVVDLTVDKPTPQHFFTDVSLLYFNPSLDYSGNSNGDYLFYQSYSGTQTRLLYWKAPFTSGYWVGDAPSNLGIGNTNIGISPDFPQIAPHLIYETRINLDAMGIANKSFGFAMDVQDFGGKRAETWPRELAQNDWKQSAHGTSVIPSYSGTCELALQPVDEFSELMRSLILGSSIGTVFLLLRKLTKSHEGKL
jgi:hypothetical protein